ncbi:hypothetical protein D3C75_630190 [compost metagenome]
MQPILDGLAEPLHRLRAKHMAQGEQRGFAEILVIFAPHIHLPAPLRLKQLRPGPGNRQAVQAGQVRHHHQRVDANHRIPAFRVRQLQIAEAWVAPPALRHICEYAALQEFSAEVRMEKAADARGDDQLRQFILMPIGLHLLIEARLGGVALKYNLRRVEAGPFPRLLPPGEVLLHRHLQRTRHHRQQRGDKIISRPSFFLGFSVQSLHLLRTFYPYHTTLFPAEPKHNSVSM